MGQRYSDTTTAIFWPLKVDKQTTSSYPGGDSLGTDLSVEVVYLRHKHNGGRNKRKNT